MIPDAISRYRIVSKLAAGGMGEVYLAEDVTLGRPVALKLLPARFTQNAQRVRRFEQEARAVSTLNHPNILTIYEIGQIRTEAGETHFMAMEFVGGQTLRQHMSRQRLTPQEGVEIAIQVCGALVAAHGAGITHRDIKPENVMLRRDGLVKVLDFGLAKLTESHFFSPDDSAVTQADTIDEPLAAPDRAAALDDQQDTSPGVMLGTVKYMSPEQTRGLTVDARTDIFSLGVVLYEMIAGRPPFEATTTADMIVAILEREPAPLTQDSPPVSDELASIVTKALAKARGDRYQSAVSLLTDLKRLQRQWLIAAGPGATAEVASRGADRPEPHRETSSGSGRAVTTAGRPVSGSHRAPIDSLAVLPFFTSSDDPNAAYLSEGIPESLILNLSRVSALRVIAWSTVARFRDREVDPLAIGRELGVRAIVVGRMYQFSNKLVIKAELVDVSDGSQIWGERFQRNLDDLFTIDQEISQEICEHLRLKLNEAEKARLAKRYTDNATAYQFYLKGRYYWNQRTAKALKKAIESFEEAIKLDDSYALAYSGLADCYCVVTIYGAAPPKVVMPRAKIAAMKALAIDEGLAEAHTSLAAALVWFDWDWEQSEREFKRAIELNPAYTVAHHWYGSVLLSAQQRFAEALASEMRALTLEPLSLVINSNLGFICYQASRFDEAVEYLVKTLEMDENFIYARFHLGLSYAHQGRFDEAIAELQRTIELAGGRGALLHSALAYAYGVAGRRDEALKILASLQASPMNRDASPFHLAIVHAGLADTQQALRWLERAVDERFNWVVWLRTEPMFARLRGEPKFIELARRIGLTDQERPVQWTRENR